MEKADRVALGRRRTRAKENLARITDEAKEAVRAAAAAGVTEVELSHDFAVDRMTIRDWLGKKR